MWVCNIIPRMWRPLSSPIHACPLLKCCTQSSVKPNSPCCTVLSPSFGEGELKSTRHNILRKVRVWQGWEEGGKRKKRGGEQGERWDWSEREILTCAKMTDLLPGKHSQKINERKYYATQIGNEEPTPEARTWSTKHLLWSRGEKIDTWTLVVALKRRSSRWAWEILKGIDGAQ